MYPPHHPVSTVEAQHADLEASARFGIPSLVLMEHAGRALAMVASELCPPLGVVVTLCGPGNNGGDGYACARFLRSFGVPVRVVQASEAPPRSSDARLEHTLVAAETPLALVRSAQDEPIFVRALEGAALIVDALFGIGLTRPLEAPYTRWIELANASDALRLSADVPSGLDADTGEPRPISIRADVTAAMGVPKRGCFTSAGRPYAGRVIEVDIGLPRTIHERWL